MTKHRFEPTVYHTVLGTLPPALFSSGPGCCPLRQHGMRAVRRGHLLGAFETSFPTRTEALAYIQGMHGVTRVLEPV